MFKSHFLKSLFSVTLVILALISFAAHAETINGAGATFPYPLYAKWANQYNQITGTQINYQSIGSGGGIAQIKAKTVDFGASDAPLKKEDLDQNGLMQFPMTVGGVTLVVNLPGVNPGTLKITPDVAADIFLGKITMWNDARLAKANADVKLPATNITVVHRADGSGTSWIFTNYLAEVSPEWKEKVGAANAVNWPAGVGGKGNEGVAAYVQRIAGSIGYVEYAYALQNKMNYTLLQNKAGVFVAPTIESFQAAAASADWQNAPGMYLVMVNQAGENSWPITGASFILMHSSQADMKKAKEVLKFFDWAYKHGTQMATDLHYVPMPENVVGMVGEKWKTLKGADNQNVWP